MPAHVEHSASGFRFARPPGVAEGPKHASAGPIRTGLEDPYRGGATVGVHAQLVTLAMHTVLTAAGLRALTYFASFCTPSMPPERGTTCRKAAALNTVEFGLTTRPAVGPVPTAENRSRMIEENHNHAPRI